MDNDSINKSIMLCILIVLLASLVSIQPVVQADVVSTNDTNLGSAIDDGAFVTITFPHYETHEGDHFFTGAYTTLANGEVYDILYVTPNSTKYSHMIFEIETESESMFEYYEGATTSDDGTPLVMFNRNRNSNNTPTLTFTHSPAVVSTGDLIGRRIFGSGKKIGGGIRDSNEIILKANTKYLFRVTNNVGTSNWYDWQFDWYEHTLD